MTTPALSEERMLKIIGDMGFEVRVAHMRRVRCFGRVVELPKRYVVNTDKILPGGGATQVRLEKNGKTISTGIAWCSKKDNFCRKTGRTIAMHRALFGSMPVIVDEAA